jgi:hypothetical protein
MLPRLNVGKFLVNTQPDQKIMNAIHFIEKLNKAKKISTAPLIWETGDWDVSEKTAAELVGGDLYLHTAQDAPSHFGGRITGYRVLTTAPVGRIVFQISPSMAHKDVRAGREGWGMEQKHVR